MDTEDMEITRQLNDLKNKLYYSENAVIAKLNAKAYHNVYVKLREEELRLDSYLGLADQPIQEIYDRVKEKRKLFDEQNAINDDTEDYLFININPREDVSIDEIQKTMGKVLQKKWLKDAIYVIEQRGKDLSEVCKGKHIHLLVHRNGQKPSDVKREIANTVKHICDVETQRRYGWKTGAYVPYLQQSKTVKNRLTYMLGNKSTLVKKTKEYNFKDVKQEMDRVMRQRFNLQDFYSKGNIDTSGVQFYTSGATTSDVDV